MAQIIKIHDYISRYELDPYHYINQFVRLKKERWLSLLEAAERQHEERQARAKEPEPVQKRKKFSLKRRKEEINADIQEERHQWFEEEDNFHVRLPTSRMALASFYKRHLYEFQLKWASSTLAEMSHLSNQVKQDRILRYLTQQLPDSYFIMYKPVLKIQQAAVELSIVIISPLDIYCVTFLEAEEDSVYIGSKNRFWEKKTASQTASVLNPGLSLFRTESVVSKIIKEKQADIPVRKLLLSRTSYIDYPEAPYGLEIVDKRSAEEWMERQKKNTAPVKHHQVKAAKALLSYCMSDSYRRREWLE